MTKRKWDKLFVPIDFRPLRKAETEMLWAQAVENFYPKIPIAARDTIERGQQAWERIKSSSRQRQNYRDWQALSDGVEVIESMCTQIAGKSAGGGYARLIQASLKLNGMDDIATSTRTWMRQVREHQSEIDVWRNGLPPEQKLKMNHPRTILEHWRKASRS